jgi:hypothetical protein
MISIHEGLRLLINNALAACTRERHTQANELLHGRLAMLGFAAAVINQLRLGGVYGPGPLAQVRTTAFSTSTSQILGITSCEVLSDKPAYLPDANVKNKSVDSWVRLCMSWLHALNILG